MKKLLMMITATIILVGCGSKSNKVQVEQSLMTKKLILAATCTQLDVSGDWSVKICDSISQPIIVYDGSIMDYLEIDEGEKKLVLDNDSKMKAKLSPCPRPCLQLPSYCNFNKINLSGSATIEGATRWEGVNLELNMIENSQFLVDSLIFVKDLVIEMNDATSFMNKWLNMNELEMDMNGNSEAKLCVDGNQKEVNVKMNGYSTMGLICNVASLNMEIDDFSKVNLAGKVAEFEADLSGSSITEGIENRDLLDSSSLFVANKAKVSIDKNAKLTLKCTNRLKINASENASVSYMGSPKKSIRTVDLSRVKAL